MFLAKFLPLHESFMLPEWRQIPRPPDWHFSTLKRVSKPLQPVNVKFFFHLKLPFSERQLKFVKTYRKKINFSSPSLLLFFEKGVIIFERSVRRLWTCADGLDGAEMRRYGEIENQRVVRGSNDMWGISAVGRTPRSYWCEKANSVATWLDGLSGKETYQMRH